jgi:uroporphyrinogen decarboxylase
MATIPLYPYGYKLSLKGKKEIDEEIRRIYPLLSKGGYIPWTDHSIPPNVPLENFLYYMTRLENAINGTE